MAGEKKKSWLTWLIVGLCLLSVPVGIYSKQLLRDDKGDGSGSLSLLRGKIKVIFLTGMIMDRDEESVLSLTGTTQSTMKKIRKAIKDDKIKGVLLRINSPGGTVAASQEINEAVTELAAKKPVVTSMGDIAASGGYYIACATPKIYANPGSLTGSIGVIMNTMNLKGLADKVGVQAVVVKSGQFKDIASPYRPMSDEERALLQAMIMDSYSQFVEAVSTGRKMPVERVKTLADGRIYTGRQAKACGLIDELGSHEDALKELQRQCKEKYKLKADLPVDDKVSGGLLETLLEARSFVVPQTQTNDIFGGVIPKSMQAQFYNRPLWMWQ